MATTPKNFSIQEVYEILLRDPATYEILAYLTDLKTSNLMNEGTLVYPTGGRGNVYIGGAFAHSKRARIEILKATWNTSVLALQNGATVSTGANTNAVKYDVVAVTTTTGLTTATALGTAGSEILYAKEVLTDGSYGATFTQAATPSTTKFMYTPGTKTLTFFGTEAQAKNIAVAYKFNTGATAQTINIETDHFPSTVLVTAFGLVKNLCNGYMFPTEINGLAQIDPKWEFALQADGQPSTENFNLEFVKTCTDNTLYSMIVWDELDVT